MPGVLLDEMEQPVLPEIAKDPQYGFVVAHQNLDLEIDFSTQSLTGRTEITILPQTGDLETIRIDARQCIIEQGKVWVEGVEAEFDYEDPVKRMDIPKHVDWCADQYELQRDRLKPLTSDTRGKGALDILVPSNIRIQEVDPFSEKAATPVTQKAAIGVIRAGVENTNVPLSATPTLTPKTAAEQVGRWQPLKITIEFTIKNWRDGLHFIGLGEGDARYPYVYSKHSMDSGTASSIFPCIDDSAMRITWQINIKTSRTLGDALRRKAPTARPRSHAGKKDISHIHSHSNQEEYEVPLSDDEKILEMVVVCSGDQTKENVDPNDSTKKILTFDISRPVAPQHVGFAIGPFESVDLAETREEDDAEKLGQSQALQVTAYCLPGRSEEVMYTCAPVAHAVDDFTLKFGAYPFTQYSLVFVDDQLRDTEHTCSMSLCSTRLLLSEDIIDPEIESIRTIIHAAATQWFGVGIVPNERSDRWITIGLSHYMAGLFMKTLCGNNAYAFRQKTLMDKLVEQDIDRPSIYALGETLSLGAFEMDFMKLKAPLVLFILDRRILKNSSGISGLPRIISKLIISGNTGLPEESVMTTKDFRRLVEKVTKYRATESFWNQWIYGAGCPRLNITQRFNKKRLCVEMTINQSQSTLPTTRPLKKENFPRELKEELHGIYAGEIQPLFTGPLTIRIHEADGTPYEHIVEIREQNQKIEIPYNTKYKRLKRNRRQKERLNPGANVDGETGDTLYYCLGDVLQGEQDVAEWGLKDWDKETEARMDSESYEWLRIDADFEWICGTTLNVPAYMWISQLQQDRDVVAQQQSMQFLALATPHGLVATFCLRTLMDTRYYHEIRTMAANILKKHACEAAHWSGLRHLTRAYQEFFCYEGTKMPRSNDFSDKRSYWVEQAIPTALSQSRTKAGKCPKAAREFILDTLQFNDNRANPFSDNHKVANLLTALAESLMSSDPGTYKEPANYTGNGPSEPEVEDPDEIAQFRDKVLVELDRYRRMDEWINSYQNIYTTTVLEAYRKLMKAGVIPKEPLDFVQYLHDGTSDLVRIKAFESLIDLGYITHEGICGLLLNVLSTDISPYTRNQLFEIFCCGLATVAFGEAKTEGQDDKPDGPLPLKVNGDADLDIEMPIDHGGLIEEVGETAERALKAARTTSIEGALVALKEELKNNTALKEDLWKAICSPTIGVPEQWDLLDICGILYDAVESMVVKIRMPRYWRVKNRGKRPLAVERTPSFDERPAKRQKIVALKVDSRKLAEIQNKVPRPDNPSRILFTRTICFWQHQSAKAFARCNPETTARIYREKGTPVSSVDLSSRRKKATSGYLSSDSSS
ncbi:putative Transcription initiation factor TFIID subunit 2 [Glarea lozoyensis 74030]|uniref:Transcription initiation factor TFIID subunit 2 n=1 Tax=Glarea lozoyensis (strain ATCC 74030 / MF5533) TaxID=1104152 RepID=H0ECM1_GLAL7|nr:putative Transcription initiation factor TFIID subunit 2 [Glarea lozoyensis 74030]